MEKKPDITCDEAHERVEGFKKQYLEMMEAEGFGIEKFLFYEGQVLTTKLHNMLWEKVRKNYNVIVGHRC